jgi:FtsZ-binding cell division protein ZapB
VDISEAANIAKQLVNHWKAFKKMEEFIQEVVAGQVLLQELETKKASRETLLTECLALASQKKTLEAEVFNLKTEWDNLAKKIRTL